MKTIINLEEELFELKNYLPLNVGNSYFDIMFENLLLIKESEFYNNAVINLTHFYIYILHCFLIQLYYVEENRKLLQYLHKTVGSLNSRDSKKLINLDERFDVKSFENIEKDSINYFFYILDLCKDSHLCTKHQEIIDLRNSAAHLNMDIINQNRFEDFLEKINYNLSELLQKTYKHAKTIVINELQTAIDEDRIDEDFYAPIFEEINSIYCISYNFYKMLKNNHFLQEIGENRCKYYINRYVVEVLNIDEEC